MSTAILVRVTAFVLVFGVLVLLDSVFVPVSVKEIYVPKNADVARERAERRERVKKQRIASLEQEVEVERALFQLNGALEGIRLDPNNPAIKARLEKLRNKVGDVGSSAAAEGALQSLAEQDADEDFEDDSENAEDMENENGENTVKKPATNKPKKPLVAQPKLEVGTIQQRMMLLDDPSIDPERWATIRESESASSMAATVETWIAQGKTKRLGFDVFYDPLSGTSQLVRSKQNAQAEREEEKTEVPKADPGDAQRRFIARTKPSVPVAMTTFLQGLRQARTYSHISKFLDTERRLKQLGYKQSTAGGKSKVVFQGNFGESCPHFDEKQISFCNYYLPWFREQEQQQLLQMQERALRGAVPLRVENIFPTTWRFYKQVDRRALRTRTQNETLQNEGGPYINKFTFSHGAGKPSLTSKMYNQLKKSDESTRHQTQEAKQKLIAQIYCNNPYLFENRKFIVRTWAVIISGSPMMVLYHDGAVLRSVVPYTPFVKRDKNYKRAAHFTNEQSSSKGTLRSSELYASLGQFQHWLNTQKKETPNYVRDFLRPQIKARMIYALYAMMRPAPRTKADMEDDDEGSPTGLAGEGDNTEGLIKKQVKLPNDVAVVQPVCFDFLIQSGSTNIWMLGAHANGICAVNLGGDSFRPPWKIAMQTALADRLVDLGEEMLWRKVANVQLEKLTDLITDIPLDVLIDETLPGWDYIEEINWHLKGGHVDGGLGSKDVIEAVGGGDSSSSDSGGDGDDKESGDAQESGGSEEGDKDEIMEELESEEND